MLSLVRFIRSAVIAVGLASLAIVLVPQYTEPLWDWARTVAGVAGKDPLPSFGVAQHWSALSLGTFMIAGIAYNLWRDRRHRILQAEYAHRTGATHLKEKVADLQGQLRRVAAERDKWQDSYLTLNRRHTDALVAAKEYEVRSEFGRCDREMLAALRKEFDAVMHAKGHNEGFREAMHFFLARLSEPAHSPEVTVEATTTNGSARSQPEQESRPALPLGWPSRT
jgi:hypothetical protein